MRLIEVVYYETYEIVYIKDLSRLFIYETYR